MGVKKEVGQGIEPFTRDEVQALLQAVAKKWPHHYPFILTLARTGLRLGEAIALVWDDLDFTNRKIHVQRGYYKGRVSSPKSGKSRVVDMSPQLEATLRDLLLERKREALAIGRGEIPKLVFTSKQGGVLDTSNFYSRVWKKALAAAGLKHHRLHDLRHSFATQSHNGRGQHRLRQQAAWPTTV